MLHIFKVNIQYDFAPIFSFPLDIAEVVCLLQICQVLYVVLIFVT